MKKLSLFFIFIFTAIFLFLNSFQTFTLRSEDIPQIDNLEPSTNWQIFKSTTWNLPKNQPNTSNSHQNIFSADAIYYQNKNHLSHFKKPSIIQNTAEKVTFISSLKGRSQDESIIHLTGEVKIEIIEKLKPNQTDKAIIKLLTSEQITYNNKNQILTSQTRTTIQQPGFKVSADNVQADLNTNNFKFTGNVKTVYDSHKVAQ